MKYSLIWKNEEIDTATNQEEAEYLKREYNLAFEGGVEIVKIRKTSE